MPEPIKLSPKEQENALYMLWVVTLSLESRADSDPNGDLDRNEVTAAYNLFNRVGYSDARPRWEGRTTL